MKKILFSIFLLSCLVACEERHPIHGGDKMATSNITFETAGFDVQVTATTDVVTFSCSRQFPPPDGDVESDKRLLYESPDSEAKMSVHYTVETFSGRDRLVSQIQAGRTPRPLRWIAPYPSAIKQNMKLVVMNPFESTRRLQQTLLWINNVNFQPICKS